MRIKVWKDKKNKVAIIFEGDNGDEPIVIDASATKVHNKWNGDIIKGNDVAVLKLVSAATDDITRYQIDRDGSDDIGAIVDKVGFGRSGNGNDGDVLPVRRHGNDDPCL